MASEIWLGETTERFAVPGIVSSLAVMVARPTPCPVAAFEETVATVCELDDHPSNADTSCVEPSLKLPVAE